MVKFVGYADPIPVPFWAWEKAKARRAGTTSKDEFSGAYIKQIPIKLAAALTIHKSQGMTLQFVQVDLGASIFAVGQAYVALSRVTSLKGLSLISFLESSIKTEPRVSAFYEKYAGVKNTSVPDNIRLFAKALARAKGLLPEEEPEAPAPEPTEEESEDDSDDSEEEYEDEYMSESSESEVEETPKKRAPPPPPPPKTSPQAPPNQPPPQKPEPEEYIDPKLLLEGKNYYLVLDVTRYATSFDIKKAYRKACLKWHPDKNINTEKLAKMNFQYIQKAFDTLGDPQKRRVYDLTTPL
jgi:hypothetical protein